MTITRCVPVQAGSQVISVIRRLVGRCRGWPGAGSSTAVSVGATHSLPIKPLSAPATARNGYA